MFDLRRTWTSARIRSMEHIDNGQKFCVRQSILDTGFAGPEQKCLRRWSCVISPFDWRLGRMRDCISNGSVFHLFVATLLTQRGAVAETSSLSPTRSQRRRRLLARMWPQEWNLQCRWGGPTAAPLCCKQGDSGNECTGDIGGPAGGIFGWGGQHQCVAAQSLPRSRTLLAALSSFRGRESSGFAPELRWRKQKCCAFSRRGLCF